jgi:hypothetical protein
MMKTHRSSRARMLAGAAAILAFGGLSLAFGSPGLAQPDGQPQAQTQTQADTAAPQRRGERIIVRTDHDGHTTTTEHHGADGTTTERSESVIIRTDRSEGDHPAHGDEHAMTMHHDGGVHEIIIPDCAGGQSDDVNEGTDSNRTRIILCGRGHDATPAARADQLAHVRDRIAGDTDLSAEQKARVTAAIDRQIARLRGQ